MAATKPQYGEMVERQSQVANPETQQRLQGFAQFSDTVQNLKRATADTLGNAAEAANLSGIEEQKAHEIISRAYAQHGPREWSER